MTIDFEYIEKNLRSHILKKFVSKKNSVYLVEYKGEKLVAKVFRTSRHIFEFSLLNFLYSKDISIPKPFALVNQTIFMEYIEGDTLMDLINSNIPDKKKYLESLSEFFFRIHQIKKRQMSLLKGDFSIKNFIYNSKIYGLDFEESTYGNSLIDIGGTIAQILDSSPSFTEEKFYLSNFFLGTYLEKNQLELDQLKSDLKHFIIEGLLFDASFRPAQREEIEKWSIKIRKNFDQIFYKQFQ